MICQVSIIKLFRFCLKEQTLLQINAVIALAQFTMTASHVLLGLQLCQTSWIFWWWIKQYWVFISGITVKGTQYTV